MTTEQPIYNSFLDLMSKEINIIDLLGTINIEQLDDHTTKVICRTIVGSVEALKEHLKFSV